MYFMNLFILAKSQVVFFADVSDFLVISGNIVLWLYSTSFDAIPQGTQNQIRNCSSHDGACSYKVW